MSAELPRFAAGGFRFVPGVFQYSGGVAAEPGLAIRRLRFRRPVAMAEGFRAIAGRLTAAGRPLTAFCACELRSPAQFSEAGFRAFNEGYVKTLTEWGLYDGKVNPVARSNVCPELGAPSEPCFHAFCFTVPQSDAPASFVVAGSGEAPEGKGNYRDHIVCLGDVGPAGLRQKARFVLAEMERRMAALGFAWTDCTGTQVYTVHDPHPFLADEIVVRGAASHGLTWHYCRPPVEGLEFEMDCRGLAREDVLAG